MKISSLRKMLTSMLLGMLLLGAAAGTADAFYFRGYTYNETGATNLSGTNVTIEEYIFSGGPPTLTASYQTSSNATGYFNLTNVPDNMTSFYKIVIRHFNGSNLDYIGQALPEFPLMMLQELTIGEPMKFYLKPGGTINITAHNETNASKSFNYMVKDKKLGYPITENFTSEVENVTIYLPSGRNYSIMIYPNQSFPVSYDLDNLASGIVTDIPFNTSNTLRQVSGYANLSDGSSNFTDLNIIAYLMEPGNMVFQDQPLPYNMSGWCPPAPGPGNCEADRFNATDGYYNITLPGAMMTANILLFATAYNGSSGNYYGTFRNISLGYLNDPVTNFNFSLQTLLGDETIIQVNNASGGPGFGRTNITTKKLPFQLKNGTSGENITNTAFVEVDVNYSAYNGSSFSWMVDVQSTSNGSFSVPAINANIRTINVFLQESAPLKTSKTAAQLAAWPVIINLSSFDPRGIEESSFNNIAMDMLKSTPVCDVPYPPPGCSLFPPGGKSKGDFNPFKIVMGGGKISMRMTLLSNNITVHYKNVDMLASGPPDAMFDSNASQSQNGSTMEQAWRFGSMGPEIYDEVLVGMPIASGINLSNVSVSLEKLYDNDWNTSWNLSAGNTTADLPSDYSTFNSTWFTTGGMQCSTADQNANCYVNIADRMVWIKIPHFSGVGPTVSGSSGNLTVNLTNSSGTAGSSVTMNFSAIDTANTTLWYNISFPSGFNAAGAVVNITINSTTDPADWNKTAAASYVNVTSTSTAYANNSEVQHINMSGVTVSSTTGNHTINISTSNGLTASLNYTVVEYRASLTNISALSSSTTSGINATYTLNLTNNGTAADSYTLAVTNPDSASITGLNISSPYVLSSGETKIFALNVTNPSAGTFRVNVTATSQNDTSRFSYINTTTTLTASGPNITSWENNKTGDTSTSLSVNSTEFINFNATANQSITTWSWFKNNSNQSNNYNNFTTNFTTGSHTIKVNATNANGTSSTITWSVTATAAPIGTTITLPATNNSEVTTSYVNVTVSLNRTGMATLNWQGINESMLPSGTGTSFYRNKSINLSGNYSFRVYANTTEGATNASGLWVVIVNLTSDTNLTAYVNSITGNTSQQVNISAPSTNVTVMIMNGTNATVGGITVTNITVDSPEQVNSTYTLSGSDRFVGENLTLGPSGARFIPEIQIRFNYTSAQLTAAGITESSLSVKFYNTTTSSWEALTVSRNTTGSYLIANVSHLSTFALIGTPATSTPSSGGGSGGGYGGGGVVTTEPFDNIAKAERYEKGLTAGVPVTYSFKAPEHGIYEVVVTGKENEDYITIRVEALKDTSWLVTTRAPGTIYRNVNVWAGTKKIKEAVIRFKIENSWLGSNNFADGDVEMFNWDGSQWVQLETARIGKDGTYTYFEAKTAGAFSSFAITGLKGAAKPTAEATSSTATVTRTAAAAPETPRVTETPEEEIPGFEAVITIFTIAILAASLRNNRKK